MILNLKNGSAFSIIELIIVLAILALVGSLSIAFYLSLQRESDIKNASEEVLNVLRIAQSQTLASQDNSQYGIYFNLDSPQYTLFKGTSFATRDTAADKNYQLPKDAVFALINLTDTEAVFNRLSGTLTNTGSVVVRLNTDFSKLRTIYLSSSGAIGYTLPVTVLPAAADSRHLHLDYNRAIGSGEVVTLIFDNTYTKTIPIDSNMVGGEFYWEGTISTGSDSQTIKIHSHLFNSPYTQFCIHRDRRDNTKSLNVLISGDISGNIVEYSANGLITNYPSIYVSNSSWQ